MPQPLSLNAANSIAWCSRVANLLALHKRGALERAVRSMPQLLAGIESEAIEGERIAAFPPGPEREAATRLVARLDHITVDLSGKLLDANLKHQRLKHFS